MMRKNTIIFVFGHHGSGKSSLIKQKFIAKNNILVKINSNTYILGDENGTDCLCKYKKTDIRNYIMSTNDANFIIAGLFYFRQIDLATFKEKFRIVLIYLKADKEILEKRILARSGNPMNPVTYKKNCRRIISTLRKKHLYDKLYVINTNKDLKTCREKYQAILKKELFNNVEEFDYAEQT